LVGAESSDDAGVYLLTADTALVQTLDFITPPVNDPLAFGRIAAANSLSDVYAMGGRPLTAMNIVCFPEMDLEIGVLREMMVGGAEKIAEAGAVLVGGHTVRDNEPKYGLSVTGVVHPERIWRNRGARPGDALILTKAVGTGVLFNANRRVPLAPAEYDAMVASAERLNRYAAEVLGDFEVHAATDITGFGLAGHASEMARGGVRLEIRMSALPVLPGARDAYARGVSTGANRPNRVYCGPGLDVDPAIDALDLNLAFDPQTSGGLLVALPAAQTGAALERLRAGGDMASAVVGRVVLPGEGELAGVSLIA
jgi:selenide,water dikinase